MCYTQYSRTAEHFKSAIWKHFAYSKVVLLYDLGQLLNLFMYILFCDEPLDGVFTRHGSTAFMQLRLMIMKKNKFHNPKYIST